jgi:hypothetical protein
VAVAVTTMAGAEVAIVAVVDRPDDIFLRPPPLAASFMTDPVLEPF